MITSHHAPVALVDLANGAAHPLERLRGLKVLAIAGIGQPELFFQDLKDLGAEVLQTVPYPDHHRFQPEDVAKLDQWAGLMNADAVVTTEKDGVRLRPFLPLARPGPGPAHRSAAERPGHLGAGSRRDAGAGSQRASGEEPSG